MENSRAKILSAVKLNQGGGNDLPLLKQFEQPYEPVSKFMEVLKSIGGKVYRVNNLQEVEAHIRKNFGELKRIISNASLFITETKESKAYTDLSSLHDLDLFITESTLGVAENGAVWLVEKDLKERVFPFIAQHVAIVIDHRNIVSTMHEAYLKIGDTDYAFATFIAGPSKTADIEQSLVLGAHGAISMHVFIL